MKQYLAEKIIFILRPDFNVVLLRGSDAEAREHGDLDFLVQFDKSKEACLKIVTDLYEDGWRLLSYRHIGYLSTITLVLLDNSITYSIKVDIFNGLSWRGLGRGTADEKFFGEINSLNLNESRSFEFISATNFLLKSMYAGKLSERDMRRLACDSSVVKQLLEILDWKIEIDNFPNGPGWRDQWLLRYRSANIKSLRQVAQWFYKLLFLSIGSRLGYRFGSGLVLSLSGMDGSGKTTQLDRILNWYSASGTNVPYNFHFIPSWLPLPHQLFRRKKSFANYASPYSEPVTRSRFSLGVRIFWYGCVFALAKIHVSSLARLGKVTILDRSFIDFAADMSRVRIPHINLNTNILKLFAPNGINIYLDVAPEIAVARKGELTVEKARKLQLSYISILENIDGICVNASLTQNEVSYEILNLIDRHFRSRIFAAKMGLM